MSNPKLNTTDNFKLFSENSEQRPLNKGHVRSLIASMTTHGYLDSKPIQVHKEGRKFVIIDGHHRFNAAKTLGYPFTYVVDKPKAQETMADVNSKVLQWKLIDFLRLYAGRGIQSYQIALEYHARGIPCSLCVSLLAGNTCGGSRRVGMLIRNGEFEIKETAKIDKILKLIETFSGSIPTIASASFISALATCLSIDSFDFDRLVEKLHKAHHLIGDSPTKEKIFGYIEAVYNYNSTKKQPIAFKAAEVSRASKAGKVAS